MVTTVKKIEIDTEILNKISEMAKDQNTTETKIINDMLKKEVEKPRNKILDYLIANKDTYNPDPKRLMSMAGIIKTDRSVDAVKLVREMREGWHDIP